MRYHNITKDDMLNGSGLRVVLWVSGCGHACEGCHNKITWDCNSGLEFDSSALEEIETELKKDHISGLTLSGGDPLFIQNREAITNLVIYLKDKYPKKNIWLYTGYEYSEISHLDVIRYIDVLVDGKYIKELNDASLEYRGSTNQRIIKLKGGKIYE